jgi:hypothetical protein
MTGSRIGELNGRWALLLKITLIVVPFITTLVTAAFIPWAVWVTGNIYTSRQTSEMMTQLIADSKAVNIRIDSLPPEEWKARIRVLEDDSRQNLKDHQVIIISLEQIKAAVGAVGIKPK